MLDELGDIIQGKPRFEITKIAGRHLEGPPLGGGPPAFQTAAQGFVDELAEGPAGTLRLSLELCSDVVIEGQRRSHALMLKPKHHDVKGLAVALTQASAIEPNVVDVWWPPARRR